MLLIAALSAAIVLVARAGEYDLTSSWSMLRCLLGFGLGVGIAQLRKAPRHAVEQIAGDRDAFGRGTLVELAGVAACILFLSLVQVPYLILAPVLFAGTIWIFSFERGLVSRLLQARPLVWLGLLSYSIYLTHMLVVSRLPDAAKVLASIGGPEMFADCGNGVQCIAQDSWQAVAYLLVFAVLVLIASIMAHLLVEEPFRRWSRARVRAAAARRAVRPAAPVGLAKLELSGR